MTAHVSAERTHHDFFTKPNRQKVQINNQPDKGKLLRALFETSSDSVNGFFGSYASMASRCIEQAVRDACLKTDSHILSLKHAKDVQQLCRSGLLESIYEGAEHYYAITLHVLNMNPRERFNWRDFWEASIESTVASVTAHWQRHRSTERIVALDYKSSIELYERHVTQNIEHLLKLAAIDAHQIYKHWHVMRDRSKAITVVQCVVGGARIEVLHILNTYVCARYFNCDHAAIISELPLSEKAALLSDTLGVRVVSRLDLRTLFSGRLH